MHTEKFRGTARFSPAAATMLLCLIPACATLSSTNYLSAQLPPGVSSSCARPCFHRDPAECTVACARVRVPDGDLLIYARGGPHTIARGPCLLPVVPDDAPLRESEHIYLSIQWNFDRAVRIYSSSFEARFADGSKLLPRGISFYEIETDAIESFADYASYAPEYGEQLRTSYDLSNRARVELPYPRSYAQTEWLELRPQLALRDADGAYHHLIVPAMQFQPAREYGYSAFEFPFYFGSVR